jgi:hypothetical protein
MMREKEATARCVTGGNARGSWADTASVMQIAVDRSALAFLGAVPQCRITIQFCSGVLHRPNPELFVPHRGHGHSADTRLYDIVHIRDKSLK